ncbi:methylenetetrahydrofolate reductase C-terminal domain-containing protein [Subtercola sp. PAMC28395]|uniref:methylenetetrahydrofolate reductase C-terminal domain-containing protein n=1 Tax=Subtercola sp. PAMC28395 TaxID=2846775 RepID=UPI001C0D0332|nr:methylenetetrahydrofolate reductase C-terminal domain-containing protein [Subtercola sp. PAMC28395]QWT22798.1 methylenetetrahydrofolate reductase C-terminal domain-containing protein [Subtercola sp. PAMC28395]
MERVQEAVFSCPKSMTYGPCGGVEFDGTCEVSEHRCVFVDRETVAWRGPMPVLLVDRPASDGSPGVVAVPSDPVSPGGAEFAQLIRSRQVVVADFPAKAVDRVSLAECADLLAGSADATLAGDSGAHRVQFSPSYRAQLIQSRGLRVIAGFNCRDRNRVAIEGELAGLADVGVAAVHCVTGDHTLTGSRPDAKPVFDLDSTGVASLAAEYGHLVSVGESPATPPVAHRAERLVEKQRAGAALAFVNHAGGAAPVARFIAEVRERQVEREHGEARLPGLAYIACVPVVVDRGSAELLRSFTTLVLPDGYLERILGARDVYAEGIAAAIDLSNELLTLDGVSGVNLSGGPEDGRESFFAEALARIASGVSLRIHGAG